MMSCCSGASRRQTGSAIKPSRRPIVPLQATGPAAACPAQLLSPIWQWFWKTASSPSTRLSSTRSSPAFKRPKRTSARTDFRSRTVTPRALPSDRIIHHPGTCTRLCPWKFLAKEKLWGCFAIKLSRGSRCNKHTQSFYVSDTLQSCYLLSFWHTYSFVSQG